MASLPNHVAAMRMLGVLLALGAAVLVILFNLSSDRKLVKALMAAFALCDIGVIGTAALGLGDKMTQFHLWNQMAWANIGFSVSPSLLWPNYICTPAQPLRKPSCKWHTVPDLPVSTSKWILLASTNLWLVFRLSCLSYGLPLSWVSLTVLFPVLPKPRSPCSRMSLCGCSRVCSRQSTISARLQCNTLLTPGCNILIILPMQ